MESEPFKAAAACISLSITFICPRGLRPGTDLGRDPQSGFNSSLVPRPFFAGEEKTLYSYDRVG